MSHVCKHLRRETNCAQQVEASVIIIKPRGFVSLRGLRWISTITASSPVQLMHQSQLSSRGGDRCERELGDARQATGALACLLQLVTGAGTLHLQDNLSLSTIPSSCSLISDPRLHL